MNKHMIELYKAILGWYSWTTINDLHVDDSLSNSVIKNIRFVLHNKMGLEKAYATFVLSHDNCHRSYYTYGGYETNDRRKLFTNQTYIEFVLSERKNR
jgi:hypothetical protein